jgi:hypothetical protein
MSPLLPVLVALFLKVSLRVSLKGFLVVCLEV